MRVLIVELQGRGGFWHYANTLAGALRDVGIEVALATTRDFEPLDPRIPVHLIDDGIPPASPVLAALRRPWSHTGKLARLGGLLESFRPEVVHLQGPIGRFDFLYFPWLRARGARVVYTAHNPRPRTGAVGLLDRARYRQVDALITLSRTGVRDLIDDGVAAEKIAYIPHGNYLQLCTRTFAPQEARRMLGIPPDARVVLFFGGMSPYKGLDVLIDAMAVLRVRQPDAFLLAAGPSKRGIDSYRARIDAHGLTRIVALRPGYVPLEQVPLYFSSADVVVLPYRGSYQSGVVHLAYAFARPVVVSNIRDLREQVLEDGTGLVAGLDPTEFGGALAELLNDPGRSSAMGRRGRDLAETKYSWETIARQTLEVYARVGVDMSLAQSRAH